MKAFNPLWTTLEHRIARKFEPDFDNMLAVLSRKVPKRPTLFEFFLNEDLYAGLSGMKSVTDVVDRCRMMIRAFHAAGYDYTTLHAADFGFPSAQHAVAGMKSVSQSHDGLVTDRAAFDRYPWPEPDDCDFSRLDVLAPELPAGMKFIVYGPGGVLENVIQIVGYEDLCYMMVDDMPLVEDMFEAVGSRLVRYYAHVANHEAVGALISNDDWGHSTQTMLSTEMMKRLVVPWHKEISRTIHSAGKPAILHSCGQLKEVMDDVIGTIGYQAKHSFEDKIFPVEEAYEAWHDQIAILGGIDLDFVCRGEPEAIWQRSVDMLQRAATRGGYALGSGNSIPYYVPVENYLAMISAVEAFD
jgi:uroporphyrinogen decarboxylase